MTYQPSKKRVIGIFGRKSDALLETFFADFLLGVAGESYAEFLEYLMVYFAEHHCGMGLAAIELGQFLKGATAVLVVGGDYREGHEHFVSVKARVDAAQIGGLGVLDRLDHILGDEFDGVLDAGEVLDGVEYQRGARTQKVR